MLVGKGLRKALHNELPKSSSTELPEGFVDGAPNELRSPVEERASGPRSARSEELRGKAQRCRENVCQALQKNLLQRAPMQGAPKELPAKTSLETRAPSELCRTSSQELDRRSFRRTLQQELSDGSTQRGRKALYRATQRELPKSVSARTPAELCTERSRRLVGWSV